MATDRFDRIGTTLALALMAGGSVAAATLQPSHPADGTADFPSGVPLDVLYGQLDDPSGSVFTDQAFEVSYAAYDSAGADDFVVPADVFGWDIVVVNTPGQFSPPAGQVPLAVNVAFHYDAGGLPGGVARECDFPANTDFTTDGTGDLSIQVTCMLFPGTYWYSQQVRVDFDPSGQHAWSTRNAAEGNAAAWKNPGDGFLTGCSDWSPAAGCGQVGEDMLFELLGQESPSCQLDCFPPAVPAYGFKGTLLLIVSLGSSAAYVLFRRR